ncbi:NAD-binding protein [Rickenella mellea]|uniref:NAD-binding protein n=1 Tax=Rickenella mellea TaxID=50990 RepID=A0A4Y7PGG8_9AGAM|nr:NAD-binding protein [Rickenella mellea]
MAYLDSLFSLEGKTALVTGGTRGIGQAITLALAKAGADIILIQRNNSNDETATKIKDLSRKVSAITCDLASKEQVGSVIQKITSSKDDGGMGETVDILVNCGGIQRRSPAELFSDDDWAEVLQVNLHTVWTLSRDVGRHMLNECSSTSQESPIPAEHHERGRGKIINIASLLSFQGGLTVPAYAAAKHGVLGLTKALSNEWSGKGINVNCVAPGYIATEMNTALIENPTRSRQIMERIPMGRWGSPTDFEGVVVFLASKASDYVCGETITVDGGWMAR